MLASDHASPGGRDDRRAARPLGSGEPRCQHVDACGRPCESSALGPPYGSGSSALAVDLPRRSAFRGGAGNQWEREELGIDKASYFFWGCGAYPKGTVALLLEGMPSGVSCTATPFDTGGCESGCFLRAGQSLSDAERRATLDRFTLENGARAAEYDAHYIADLFDDPLDYVRLPQHSRPPRLPVHELSSPTDDRRDGPSRFVSTETSRCRPSGSGRWSCAGAINFASYRRGTAELRSSPPARMTSGKRLQRRCCHELEPPGLQHRR
jgi:hypothetical protein